MKKTILVITTAALLCGCGKPTATPQSDPRLELIEVRLAALETNITELYLRNDNRKAMESNILSVQGDMLETMEKYSDGIKRIGVAMTNASVALDSLQLVLTNLSQPRPATQPAQMSAAVASGIRAYAAQRWPNDYDMQLYEIKQQVEAWRKLHP